MDASRTIPQGHARAGRRSQRAYLLWARRRPRRVAKQHRLEKRPTLSTSEGCGRHTNSDIGSSRSVAMWRKPPVLDEGVCLDHGGTSGGLTLATPNDSGAFPSLDAKLASALSRSSCREKLIRAINSVKEQLALEGKLMRGRQIWFKVCKHLWISETEGSILDFCDIMQVKLHNNQLVAFLNGRAYVLGAMQMLTRTSSWSR